MTEPEGTAAMAADVLRGVHRFSMLDSRIQAESDCYVLVDDDGKVVLIDPLPLGDAVVLGGASVEAIILTCSSHERSSARYSRELGCPIWAPQGAVDFEEITPDRWYSDGDELPGGVQAVHAPGPTDAHYALYLDKGPGVIFCADLLANMGGRGLVFLPDEYQDDPRLSRESARKLLDFNFDILCPDHGDPIISGARTAIANALERDQG